MKKFEKTIWWTLTLGIMFGIFYFSNQTGDTSSGQSLKVLETILGPLYNSLSVDTLDKLHTLLRKGAHFSIYFCLGVSVINLLLTYKVKRAQIITVLICFLYALSDEIHQTFVPDRAGQFTDVMIDTLGSTAAVGVVTFFRKKVCKNGN